MLMLISICRITHKTPTIAISTNIYIYIYMLPCPVLPRPPPPMVWVGGIRRRGAHPRGGGEALETQESQQHQKQAEPHTTAPHPQGVGAALETQESQQHQKQAGRSTRNPRKSTASETSRAPHHSSTSTGGGKH